MDLKTWLDGERGRYVYLARKLGVTVGRVSQMARAGVPKAHLVAVRDLTGGDVSLEEMLDPAATPLGGWPEMNPSPDDLICCPTDGGELL